MKKIIFVTLVLASLFYTAHTQEYKIDFTTGTLQIEGYDNLIIEGYEGDKVLIYKEIESKDETIKKTGRTSNNNTERKDPSDPELTYEIQGKELKILSEHSFDVYRLKIPRNLNIVCKTSNYYYSVRKDKNISIQDVSGEIELLAQDLVNVTLKNTSGAISVVTYGNIKADFKKITSEGSLYFDTYRGSVELTLPDDASLHIKLTSKKGNIYSDLTVKKEKKENQSGILLGRIGTGNIDLIVNTEAGGDIYLRKNK